MLNDSIHTGISLLIFFSSSTLFIFSSGDTAGAVLHICHGVKSSFDHHHRVIVWRMARGMLFVYMHLMFIDYYYCVVCVVRYVKGVRSAHLFTQNIWINESTGEQQQKSTSESLNEWYFCCVYRTLLSAIMEIPNFRCFWIEKKNVWWRIWLTDTDGAVWRWLLWYVKLLSMPPIIQPLRFVLNGNSAAPVWRNRNSMQHPSIYRMSRQLCQNPNGHSSFRT